MQTMMSRHNQNRRSSGFTLIEVLIAFVVMAAGLLALLNFHSSTQTNAAEAKMQAEATALADGKLQELSTYLTSTDVRLNETTCDPVSETVSGQLADFTLCWEVEDDPDNASQKTATVTVSWTDRNDDAQEVVLSSEVYFRSPTQGPENLLRLVHANSSTSAGGSWGSGGQGTEDPPSDDQPPGDDEPPQDENPPGDGDPANSYYDLSISGRIDTHQGGRFGQVWAQGNYTMECTDFGSSYECIASMPTGSSWTGTVYFSASKRSVCTPSGGSVSFSGITSNATQDVYIAKC